MARAAAVLVLGLSACTPDPPRKATLVEGLPRTENVVELKGVAIDRFDRDRLASRAALARAKVDRAEGTITGEEIGIEAFDEQGDVSARIVAPSGKAQRGTAILEGGVVLTDREGRVVRSEKMIYDADRNTITAPNAVTIEGENFRAGGTALVYDGKKELIEVTGPTTATVTPDVEAQRRSRSSK